MFSFIMPSLVSLLTLLTTWGVKQIGHLRIVLVVQTFKNDHYFNFSPRCVTILLSPCENQSIEEHLIAAFY